MTSAQARSRGSVSVQLPKQAPAQQRAARRGARGRWLSDCCSDYAIGICSYRLNACFWSAEQHRMLGHPLPPRSRAAHSTQNTQDTHSVDNTHNARSPHRTRTRKQDTQHTHDTHRTQHIHKTNFAMICVFLPLFLSYAQTFILVNSIIMNFFGISQFYSKRFVPC